MNLQENINRIKQMMGLLTEDFDWDFVHEIVTMKHSKKIYDLLLKMFPGQKEIITYHYNDELGLPFAEWKRKIHDIKDWVLEGPITVSPNEIVMDKESFNERSKKYDDYVSGKITKYFRDNDSDPRKINFNKIPPVTLEKNDGFYLVDDGMHRVFLAKKMNKPLKAYVWIHKPNDSPFVKEIEKLFKKNHERPQENILRISETSYREFDDIENSVWRKFVRNGQYRKAINYLINYLNNNKSELESWQIGGILWHVGQLYAFENDYKNAIKFMSKKFVPDSIERNYQMGTISFLKRDLESLKKYYDNLVEDDPTGGSGRDILKKFINNINEPYSVVYNSD